MDPLSPLIILKKSNKKNVRVGTPLTKLSGSAHGHIVFGVYSVDVGVMLSSSHQSQIGQFDHLW